VTARPDRSDRGGSGAPRGRLRVGCSGYEYDDWARTFYPGTLPRRDRLAYYASQFDTVEINATFSRLPTESTIVRWRARVPQQFVFALKISGFGTHRKKLRDPESWFPGFVERVRHLGRALGPLLAQLPPHWDANPERLEEFLAVAPRGLRVAVEVRDPSWWRDDVYDVLRRHDAALVQHDLLAGHPRVRTASWAYLRFHGPDAAHPYVGSYPGQALAAAARRIDTLLAGGCDVYAYFNNDVGGAAPSDAERLRRFVAARPTQA